MEKKRYWRFDFTERATADDEEELIRKMTELLREAVEVRLHSEVALGALLSGGLDSSLIVSIMSRLVSDPIHIFSIGFQDKQFNELRYARLLSEESLARGYFDPDRLTEFVGNYGEADSYAVWTLYVLEAWHRTARAAESPFPDAESEGRALLLAR